MDSRSTTASSAPNSRLPALFAIACFILSILFYGGSVLSLPLERTILLDLVPYPDAVEYFAQANSLLETGRPTIQIGFNRLPSRYPPGYPVLMLPWLKFLTHDKILAPFRTNQTIGFLLLAGSFAFYFLIGRPLAAGSAVLLLATQPAFVAFSRSSMSDLSAGALIVASFAMAYYGFRTRRHWLIYASAFVLGLSVSVRVQLLFFSPMLIVIAFFPVSASRSRWLTHCILVGLVFVVAASPYFFLNAVEFGNPFKTGYDFWVPALRGENSAFSVANVPHQGALLWTEITATWTKFRVANIFGTGSYVTPAFIVLAACGVPLFFRWRGFEICAFGGAALFFLSVLTFSYGDIRLYLPILFLMIGLATLAAEWALEKTVRMGPSTVTAGVLVLFVLSCIGYPSRSGFPSKGGRAQAWDALKYRKGHGKSIAFETQKEFMQKFRQFPGIVLTDIDPVYLNTLWPKRFAVAPLDAVHHYSLSKLWHYGEQDAVKLVQGGIAKNLPVYGLLSAKEGSRGIERLPTIVGYHWQQSDKLPAMAVVLTLTRDLTTESAPGMVGE